MNDNREPRMDDADEAATTRLLRLAGPRSPVSAMRAARVRAAVQVEWRRGIRRRVARRRLVTTLFAAAAAVILAVGWTNLVDRGTGPLGEPLAVVEQLEGMPRRVSGTADAATTEALSRSAAVRTGEWIETDARARVALRFADGTSVRLDIDSRLRLLSARVIELATGAVYVDTGRESGRFEVRTAMATARDVGTQFELRLLDRTVRLRVRTGLVELRDPVRSVSAGEGTEISLSGAGAVRRPIVPHGSEWDWTARVSPSLDFEGVSLAIFLEQLARENGWAIRYADPTLASEASGIVLHGSVSGLPPQEAVDVAITTSGLRHRLDNGQLLVLRHAEAR